jgi:hypothetical protein
VALGALAAALVASVLGCFVRALSRSWAASPLRRILPAVRGASRDRHGQRRLLGVLEDLLRALNGCLVIQAWGTAPPAGSSDDAFAAAAPAAFEIIRASPVVDVAARRGQALARATATEPHEPGADAARMQTDPSHAVMVPHLAPTHMASGARATSAWSAAAVFSAAPGRPTSASQKRHGGRGERLRACSARCRRAAAASTALAYAAGRPILGRRRAGDPRADLLLVRQPER